MDQAVKEVLPGRWEANRGVLKLFPAREGRHSPDRGPESKEIEAGNVHRTEVRERKMTRSELRRAAMPTSGTHHVPGREHKQRVGSAGKSQLTHWLRAEAEALQGPQEALPRECQ